MGGGGWQNQLKLFASIRAITSKLRLVHQHHRIACVIYTICLRISLQEPKEVPLQVTSKFHQLLAITPDLQLSLSIWVGYWAGPFYSRPQPASFFFLGFKLEF